MTKLFQKVLSILCVIALLVSGVAMAFAEEANEAPVTDEAAQQAAEEAARIAAEEEAARIAAAEAEAARIAAEETAAKKAAEEAEAARIAAEEAAAKKAAEEAEAARIAAEQEAAQKAAEEAEAARIAAEEAAAKKAAEEAEAARIAAEQEAAQKAAEEAEAARIAAEQEAAQKAAEEAEAARIAAEEEAARKAEEEASNNNEENSEEFGDEVDENGLVEIDDGWGYVDPDVISENTPEITDEFKGILNASMNVNEALSDTLTFGEELVITLKCGSATTVDLKLYTSADALNVKIDGKAVAFTPADSDDPAYALSTYTLENTAGRAHKISLSASDTVAFMLVAVEEQTEVQDVTPGTVELAPVVEKTEEPAPSEDNNVANTENTENTENNSGNAENTETTEPADVAENIIPVENTENTETTENTENNNEVTIEPVKPVEPAEPTIQVSMKTYSALKVGTSISDKLLGGQKAKLQVKCGKNYSVKLVLNANPDDINIKIDGTDAQFTQDGNGNYSIELNDVAFRKFTILLSAKQDLSFTLSAEAGEAANSEDEEEETEEDTNEEEINKEATEAANAVPTSKASEEAPAAEAENTEAAETAEATENTEATENAETTENTEEVKAVEGTENTEEAETAETPENTEETETTENTEETEQTEEENTEEAEGSEEEAEGTEGEAVEENKDEETEKMTALGCIKVVVTAEEGADLYAEASKESEVIGHLDAGTEAWVILNEEKTFGQIYSEDEEAPAQFISMEDAELVATEETAEEAEEEKEEETEPVTEEQLIEMGYRKVQIQNKNGADLYAATEEEAEVIGHADFESELWIKDVEIEGWAEVYTEEETKQFIKLAEIEKQMPTDEEMLEAGYIKVYVAIDIGANVYGSSAEYEGEEPVDHLDVDTELWVKLIDGAERALIFDLDEAATARYVNLVDIVATKKPVGTEELPTRELKVVSSLDGLETVYAGTTNHLEVQLINFREDDNYTVQWKYSEDGETFVDIEDADDLEFEYTVTMENAAYNWRVSVVLVTPEDVILDGATPEE